MNIRTLLLLMVAMALAACEPRDPGETRVAVIEGGPQAAAIVEGATARGLVAFDARGQIQPALAESWHVSDDGRSYIFRLARGEWSDGSTITAQQVARALQQQLRGRPLGDALGGIDEVVAMTDRVIEIRLVAARPHLLDLLANPALAVRMGDMGSGPFQPDEEELAEHDDDALHFRRDIVDRFGERSGSERVHLHLGPASEAIASFVSGHVELVLGGDFASLPLVREAAVPRGTLRYDPVIGLFGLVPLTSRGPLGDPEVRAILSQAIDRGALIEELGVPSLAPRATLLQDGLDLPRVPSQPDFLSDPASAREDAVSAWNARGNDNEPVVLAVALPEGPGGDILFARLREDWGALGIDVQRTDRDAADFALLDLVAPSPSAAWFLRQFSCSRVRICSEELDTLVDAARTAPLIEQRRAILADAGARMDEAALFIPLAAPIRWSLVGQQVSGFSENRYAIHPLAGLKAPLPPETTR